MRGHPGLGASRQAREGQGPVRVRAGALPSPRGSWRWSSQPCSVCPACLSVSLWTLNTGRQLCSHSKSQIHPNI